MAMLTAAYLLGRWAMDTLSIPEGLIRPAENPFYTFAGWHRAVNYAYVLSIHVGKSMLLDPIGFSHEYGFECIRSIEVFKKDEFWKGPMWEDVRWTVPLVLAVFVVCLGLTCLQRYMKHGQERPLLLFLVYCAWFATLFPISGIVKVGTFIADRIVVASTVAFCVFCARGLVWIFDTGTKLHWARDKRTVYALFIAAIMTFYAYKIQHRTRQWMDSLLLLQSSLVSCPRATKSHLEISKVYSGLYPEEFDLKKARYHLEQVEKIDDNYCDVHHQFAHVAIQEAKVFEFEERLTKAITCPFTMEGAANLWRRYWPVAIQQEYNKDYAQAQMRFQRYQSIVEAKIKEAEEEKENASTLQQQTLSSGGFASEL
eukprot:CAMPEP_0118687448 /NCGR_PEP_ID=MMETSP0800-20121206/8387_1 /TAXON_ID=210618 ORGANISM="Striatella unipunctata, Strain CCMP2910" /NCGR_SAMPLE_ID=MMETSP0800 /ASSEMBLY_ACC=CAM_ASM_000638 /LENGTH=369 /DNA_ID=CAMNT_0006584631 /DNA_START=526 /DNA_END=1635 /DNA_ORIENTATION=+